MTCLSFAVSRRWRCLLRQITILSSKVHVSISTSAAEGLPGAPSMEGAFTRVRAGGIIGEVGGESEYNSAQNIARDTRRQSRLSTHRQIARQN
jgi:hypothetical protein